MATMLDCDELFGEFVTAIAANTTSSLAMSMELPKGKYISKLENI
jgi:hypothetical protein